MTGGQRAGAAVVGEKMGSSHRPGCQGRGGGETSDVSSEVFHPSCSSSTHGDRTIEHPRLGHDLQLGG